MPALWPPRALLGGRAGAARSPTRAPTRGTRPAPRGSAARPVRTGEQGARRWSLGAWWASRSYVERQRLKSQLTLWAGALVFVLAAGVLAFGYVKEKILYPRQAVASVNGQAIQRRTFQSLFTFRRDLLQAQLARVEREQGMAGSGPQDALAQGKLRTQQWDIQQKLNSVYPQTYEDLIDLQVITQVSPREGVTVEQKDVDAQVDALKKQAGDDSVYLAVLSSSKVSDADLAWYTRALALRQKWLDRLGADLPKNAEQVRARRMTLPTQDDAKKVEDQVKQDGNWLGLASTRSSDSSSKYLGGELGWLPRGVESPEFDKVAFATQPGQFSDVFQDGGRWEFLQVEERAADRPIEPSTLSKLEEKKLADWLAQQKQNAKIYRAPGPW